VPASITYVNVVIHATTENELSADGASTEVLLPASTAAQPGQAVRGRSRHWSPSSETLEVDYNPSAPLDQTGSQP
jgi:hypothetical protein